MKTDNLATYLNDHLAGSVAAHELLDHLIAHSDGQDAIFYQNLKSEIAADQDVLRSAVGQIQGSESIVRKAGAWLVEKAGRAKLLLDGTTNSPLGRVEALEALTLGISGKRLLWEALNETTPDLANLNFPDLIARAERQIAAINARRIDAARAAF